MIVIPELLSVVEAMLQSRWEVLIKVLIVTSVFVLGWGDQLVTSRVVGEGG